MTPDLSLLSGFARGVLLLHVRDTCLHSGSWLLSVFLHLGIPWLWELHDSLSRNLIVGQDCKTAEELLELDKIITELLRHCLKLILAS